jgi:hypothetical protein
MPGVTAFLFAIVISIAYSLTAGARGAGLRGSTETIGALATAALPILAIKTTLASSGNGIGSVERWLQRSDTRRARGKRVVGIPSIWQHGCRWPQRD